MDTVSQAKLAHAGHAGVAAQNCAAQRTLFAGEEELPTRHATKLASKQVTPIVTPVSFAGWPQLQCGA
jgi:hypothetical protein